MDVFEYKKRYNPELGRYVKKNIYSGNVIEGQIGEGISDYLKKGVNWGFKKLGRMAGKKAGKEVEKKVEKKVEKVRKNAGDKINQLLSNKQVPSFQPSQVPSFQPSQERQTPMSDEEINERINRLMSGGKLRRIKNF